MDELRQLACYSSLSMRGKAIFRQVLKEALAINKSINEADLRQLSVFSELWETYQQLTEDIKKNGPIVVTATVAGVRRFPNPAVRMRKDCLADMMRIGTNFGFSPLDRKKLAVEEEKNDPLEEWMASNRREADEQ